jgi:16S rRNA (uracil1498-N3)-methyltransferase
MTNQEEFLLKGREMVHAVRVLRMRPGEEVILTDGLGHLARTRITSVEKNGLLLQYIERLSLADDRLPISLLAALLKPEKMDMVIQKATELGVKEIWPVSTEYSMSKNHFTHTGQQARQARWTEIARQALKQCRGAFLPEIHAIMPLKAACSALNEKTCDYTRLFCWEAAATTTDATWPEITPPCILALGPEGGFSDSDCRVLHDQKFLPVSLGQRILRAETAAIAAISITAHLISRSKTND